MITISTLVNVKPVPALDIIKQDACYLFSFDYNFLDEVLNHLPLSAGERMFAKWYAVFAVLLVLVGLQYGVRYIPFITVGSSMYPTIKYGDIVICERLNWGGGCNVGDVCVYVDRDGRYIIHRVVEVRGKHYLFKGDNNVVPDKPVPSHMVVCRVIAVVPRYLWASFTAVLLTLMYVSTLRTRGLIRVVLFECYVMMLVVSTLVPWITSTTDVTKPSMVPVVRETRANESRLIMKLENAHIVENVTCTTFDSQSLSCVMNGDVVVVEGATDRVLVIAKLRSTGYSATVIIPVSRNSTFHEDS